MEAIRRRLEEGESYHHHLLLGPKGELPRREVSFARGAPGAPEAEAGGGGAPEEEEEEFSKAENQRNRTTDEQTMMHVLKANIGTGVLAMPSAFRNVGLWLGFLLVPIIGAVCIHCMNILIQSHNHLCDRFNYESLDYDQVASLAFACGPKCFRRWAKRAHIIVTMFLLLTQVGFCCVYIMFVIENIQLAMLNLFQVHYSSTTYLLLVFPIIGLTSCTSNLKHLARISTLANVLQLIGLGLIFFDLLQFNTYSRRYESSNDQYNLTKSELAGLQMRTKSSIEVSQFISEDIRAGLPLFFATAVYAFEGIGVVLPVIKEMRNPQRILGLNGVLNSSMALVALLYMGMGFFGYAKYGQFVQGSITLNLPETTLNEIVRLTFAIAIGLSYALQFYVPWTIIWPFVDESLFYSYRPREKRDKLQILSKLSKDNHWDIDEFLHQSSCCNGAGSSNHQASAGAGRQEQQVAEELQSSLQVDYQSNASTFATSYTMSTAARRTGSSQLAHYGATAQGQQQVALAARLRRNRLEDVMEEENEDLMPEVEWRPPPRSMRGKRKLVRYTVILVSVSFTFVAAALIPRLDLFISLIGALASSSLAIIFPAIIEMCTFWNYQDDHDDNLSNQHTEAACPGASLRRSLLWLLFVAKNLLLVLFGILGLITGSWISITQLSAVYTGT